MTDKEHAKTPEQEQPEGCEIVVNKFGLRPGFVRPTDEEIIADTRRTTPVQGEQDPKDQ